MSGCRPDSTGADWFACVYGTVGCPRIHDGRTPHCRGCVGEVSGGCPFSHDPLVLEEVRPGG